MSAPLVDIEDFRTNVSIFQEHSKITKIQVNILPIS